MKPWKITALGAIAGVLLAAPARAEVMTRDFRAQTSETTTTCVQPAPTVSNGDLMVEFAESRGGSGTISGPAGWTCGTTFNFSSGYFFSNICYKTASSESGTYTFSIGGAGYNMSGCEMAVLYDAEGGSLGVQSVTASGGSETAPSVAPPATTANWQQVLAFGHADTNNIYMVNSPGWAQLTQAGAALGSNGALSAPIPVSGTTWGNWSMPAYVNHPGTGAENTIWSFVLINGVSAPSKNYRLRGTADLITGNSSTGSVPVPASVTNGDVVVASCCADQPYAIVCPSGFTLLGSYYTNNSISACWKIASGESGSYTFTNGAHQANWGCRSQAIYDNAGNPLTVLGGSVTGSTASTTGAPPAIVPTYAYDAILTDDCVNASGIILQGPTFNAYNAEANAVDAGFSVLDTLAQPTSAATVSPSTLTSATSGKWGLASLDIGPAPTATATSTATATASATATATATTTATPTATPTPRGAWFW